MSNRSRVLDIVLVLGFCLFLFAYGLGAFGLTGADEPRYAQIAREMLTRHDWVTPVLYGQPWLEKPILYYWLAMHFLQDFRGERLGCPRAFCRLGHAHGDRCLPLQLAYAASDCRGPHYARFPWWEELDAALMTASWRWCWQWRAALRPTCRLPPLSRLECSAGTRGTNAAGAGCCLGFTCFIALGTLAKGPVAPFLAAVIIIAFCLLVRQPRQIARTLWIPGVLLFLAVALPWYVEVQLRNPQFLRILHP